MQSKFVTVQGKKLHFKSFIDKTSSNKPVCLFIHGASPASQHTEFWVPLLSIIEKHCQPIFMDGYGHGLSDKPSADEVVNANVIMNIYADFIRAIMKEEKINQFVLIGRSLGGMVTHMLASSFASELLSIGLIAPARAGKTSETLKDWKKPVSVMWDYNDPMVGFESYKAIESTLQQVKLFVIGAPERQKSVQNQVRKPNTDPSHAPELLNPELFEKFLTSITQ